MKAFLTADKANKPIGSVLVDQHTNSLIVNALPRDMNAILTVLERLDKPTPQVLIEAFIVEANKDVARELGVQWGGAYQISGGDAGFSDRQDNSAWVRGGNRCGPDHRKRRRSSGHDRRGYEFRLNLPEHRKGPADRTVDCAPGRGQAHHPLHAVDYHH
jgi:hypothetical protein